MFRRFAIAVFALGVIGNLVFVPTPTMGETLLWDRTYVIDHTAWGVRWGIVLCVGCALLYVAGVFTQKSPLPQAAPTKEPQ